MTSSLKMKFTTYKNIALKLHSHFTKEKDRGRLFNSISNPIKRTMHALDLNDRTLKRWILEESKEGKDADVKRGRPPKHDSFDKDVIGRAIVRMLGENQFVTLRTLKSFLQKHHELKVKKSHLVAAGEKFRV